MAPVIFIVPGLWEGPEVFEPLKKSLEASGLTVHVSELVSTGTTAAEGLTVDHDRAAIARDLAGVVERARQDGVIVFLHSAGGFLCCDAMEAEMKLGDVLLIGRVNGAGMTVRYLLPRST